MISKCLFKKTIKSFFVIMLLLGSVMSNEMRAQSGTTVSGTILDELGMPIPGANIKEKGTANSASTDFDGKFSIRVTGPKSELVFTYIGSETVTQVVGQKKTFNVILKGKTLEEVVVIGYGTSKKSDLTGAVSSISGSDLKKVATASVAESLTGRIAGVQVVSTEGSPDSEVSIRIRGGGSVTGDSSPLIIVDGFPVNSMSDVSPNDVENITVLKDASSTAIYGSRGAYGVIIITTKGGKDNKISVSYNAFFGAKNIAKKIDVLNPEDYAKWQYEYALYKSKSSTDPGGKPDTYSKYFAPYQTYAGLKGIDWQDEIYGRTGMVQSHDLGIRGGSDKLSYSFGYSLYDESAIMMGSDFRRNNLSLNLKNKATDKIDLSFTLRYADTRVGGSGANEQKEVSSGDSRLKHAVGYSPIDIPSLTTDDTDEAVAGYLVNPFLSIADNDRDQQRTNFNMLGSFSWKLVKNLQFKSDFGLDKLNYLDYRFYGRSTYYVNNVPPPINQGKAAIEITDRKDTRFRNANTLNYDFKGIIKSDNHNLKVLLGQEMIAATSNTVTSVVQGFPTFFTFEDAKNLTTFGTPQSVDNYYSPDDRLLSFFGRINYDYKNRYLLTGTYRADGSSKFLGDNVWGYFPSVAAAWKISEESFLKDVSWINSLKVRASYGEAGNNNIPVGKTLPIYIGSNPPAWINGVTNIWSVSKTMPNPDLKWETTVTQNFGLDYDFFKGRLSGSIDVYNNIIKDGLINFPVAGTGYDFQYRNMAENQNKGIEATLNIAAIQKEDYGLSFAFNMAMNRNEVKSLGVMADFNQSSGWAGSAVAPDFVVAVGQPIGLIRGYKSDGRYEVSDFTYNSVSGSYTLKPFFMPDGVTRNPDGVTNGNGVLGTVSPGTMKLKDLNEDGKIDASDLTIIGNTNPKSTGGMVINANIKNFDFMAAFNWSYGNDVYNANKVEFTTASSTPNGQYRNLSTVMADGKRWTDFDPISGALVTDPAALEALNANTTMWSPRMSNYVTTDWAVEDGSFLRLNTFTIGYTLPESIVSKIGISKLRFYQTMSNVFVITNYSGPDPESSTRRMTNLTPGVDYSAYPRSRQIVFGLNLSF